MILGRLAAKWILAALGPEKTLLVSAAGAALCLACMYRAPGKSIVTGSALAAGFFMAAIFPTSLGLAGRYFPALVGTAINLVITGAWLGAISIPPAVGFVAQRRGVACGLLIPLGAATGMLVSPILLLSLR
jgi:fucose permease